MSDLDLNLIRELRELHKPIPVYLDKADGWGAVYPGDPIAFECRSCCRDAYGEPNASCLEEHDHEGTTCPTSELLDRWEADHA